YVGGYRALGAGAGVRWIIGVGVPEQELMGTVRRSNYETALIGLASVLLAVLFGMQLARRISGPIQRLAKETEQIAALNLEPSVLERSKLVEIDLLSTALEEMKAGLRSFQRFVPTEVVQATVRGGRDLSIGGERRSMTVLFADLVGFSNMTEKCRPEELVRVVNCFLEVATGSIVSYGGTIDKYIGDAVMAFWGAPKPSETHAADACAAALRIQSQLDDLAYALRFSGMPKPQARIGISTGDLVVGNVGSTIRLNYTVLGDHANLASRLVAINKVYGTRILLSDTTRDAAGDGIVARPFEPVLVKGRSTENLVYELVALREDACDEDLELVEVSRALLDAYLARDFEEASAMAHRILALRPADAFARTILDDCRAMRRGEVDDSWTGARRVVVTDGIPD
ncbi:MAG: adenylate/guanylate cyclase domain-containing protein, partial [Planctomycetota bacterium JB042]